MPSISIVTAARNMEATVAKTISSVTSQKRSHDQYIFIDGASTDRTAEIAKEFADKIDVLISEPDAGQYHAISKGFKKAHGDVLAWINADDILMPWTFQVVSAIFAKFPDIDWITGAPSFLSEEGDLTRVEYKPGAYPTHFIRNGWFRPKFGGFLQQESMFWRRSLWEKVDGLDVSLSLAADFDLWMRFAQHSDLIPVDIPLAAFREQPGRQRSSIHQDQYEREVMNLCSQKPSPSRLWNSLAQHGRVGSSLMRLAISARQPVITFNNYTRQWDMVTRRRSLSRLTLGQLADIRLMTRKPY
nr:glycosyltransferase family 2 protein [Gemmobacter straminiformis]